MEERFIRKYTLIMVGVCIFICASLFYLPSFAAYCNEKIAIYQQMREEAKRREQMTDLELLKYNNENLNKSGGGIASIGEKLRIPLPEGSSIDDLEVYNDYVNHVLTVSIKNSDMDLLNKDPIVGSPIHIDKFNVWEENSDLVLEIHTDTAIEPVVEKGKEKGFFYLKLANPYGIYDYIVVVDPGHGGRMPGTVQDGIKEKNVNLEIALKLKKYLDENDKIKAYYTRVDDSDISLEKRANLANEVHADLFLSIHQNALDSQGYNKVSGTQVLYDESDKNKETGSKRFAQLLLWYITNNAKTKDKGVIAGDRIYIVRSADMPVALVETGFMTNRKELDQLTDEKFQETLALSMYTAIKDAKKQGIRYTKDE